jgi:DMSO reductase anchor subunit
LGYPSIGGLVSFIFFAIGFGLAIGGLLSSTFHLGHPERAIKAFSQWKSSWLSREAWLSLFALTLSGIYALGRIFFDVDLVIIGLLSAVFCIATVFSTSMIYAQLKTVPRWNSKLTPIVFLVFSIAGGALLAGQISVALPLLAVAGITQIVSWILGDKAFAQSGTNLATATGLTVNPSEVRSFEAPHTGTNYLLQEFVFKVGRKHGAKLRIVGIILAFGMPIIFLSFPFSHITSSLSVIAHIAGMFIVRWLFFAQAEHVVGLYYGKR